MEVLKKLWTHIFLDRLRLNPKRHPLLVVDQTSDRKRRSDCDEELRRIKELALGYFDFASVRIMDHAHMVVLGAADYHHAQKTKGGSALVADVGHRGVRFAVVTAHRVMDNHNMIVDSYDMVSN